MVLVVKHSSHAHYNHFTSDPPGLCVSTMDEAVWGSREQGRQGRDGIDSPSEAGKPRTVPKWGCDEGNHSALQEWTGMVSTLLEDEQEVSNVLLFSLIGALNDIANSCYTFY